MYLTKIDLNRDFFSLSGGRFKTIKNDHVVQFRLSTTNYKLYRIKHDRESETGTQIASEPRNQMVFGIPRSFTSI